MDATVVMMIRPCPHREPLPQSPRQVITAVRVDSLKETEGDPGELSISVGGGGKGESAYGERRGGGETHHGYDVHVPTRGVAEEERGEDGTGAAVETNRKERKR